MRLTMAALMGLVLLIALGLAALRDGSAWWESLFMSATVLLLSGAVLLAIVGRPSRRATWLGLAIFGWAHLLLGYLPELNAGVVAPRTSAVLDEFIPWINPTLDAEIKRSIAGGNPNGIGYSRIHGGILGLDRFRNLSHLCCTMGIALLGATLGSYLSRR